MIAAVALLVAAGFMPSQRSDPTHWTLSEWLSWRDAEIHRLLQSSRGDGVLSRNEVFVRSAEPALVIQDCLEVDPDFFSRTTRIGNAMAHFVSFVQTQHSLASPDRLLGFNLGDSAYLARAGQALELPPLLSSQTFLKDIGDPARYRDAVSLIEDHNARLPEERKWIVLPFLSQFILSVDRTTYGRLLVLVPNEPAEDGVLVDKWIMFGIGNLQAKSVSMVAVKRNPGKASAYLMDFLRVGSDRIEVVPTPRLSRNPSNACYDCHKTGVLPIHPATEYAFDAQGALVPKAPSTDLDGRIAAYGKIELAEIDTAAYGPSIGPADHPRSDNFIRSASGIPLSPESVARIRSAMNCAACHDSVGPINYPAAVRSTRDVMAFKTDKGLLQDYVERGWMPPGNSLSTVEREALWRCLSKEYFDPASRTGVLVEWLKGKS